MNLASFLIILGGFRNLNFFNNWLYDLWIFISDDSKKEKKKFHFVLMAMDPGLYKKVEYMAIKF